MTFVWILPSTGLLLVADRVDLAGLMVYVAVDGPVAWIGAAHRTLIEQNERQTAAWWRGRRAGYVSDAWLQARRAEDRRQQKQPRSPE